MAINDLDLLVQIIVPERGNPKKGRIGTGYPLADGQVLTARHVLFGDGLDSDKPFKARWFYLCDRQAKGGGWISVQPGAVTWRGSGTLDAAVFELEFPEGVKTAPRLAARIPAPDTRFYSAGFADFGAVSRKHKRCNNESVSAIGSLLPAASEQPVMLQLDGKYERPTGWRGASGGPVIANGQIIALLSVLPSGHEGTRLDAVPAPALRQQPQFRKAVGLPPLSEQRPLALQEIVKAADADIVLALSRQLGLASGTALTDALTEDLVTQLLDGDVSDLLNAGMDAINALLNANPDPQGTLNTRSALARLVLALLPLVHDPEGIARARQQSQANAVLLDLDISSNAVAEAVMAALDEQPGWYLPYQPQKDTDGVMRLAGVPYNRGFDPDGIRMREDFSKQLEAKFGTGPVAKFKTAFYECMREVVREHITDATLEQQPDQQGQNQRIAKELQHTFQRDRGQKRRRYYYVFKLPGDPVQADACLTTLNDLQQTFQAIAFIELRLDPALHDRQFDAYRSLSDLLQYGTPNQ